VPQGLAGSRYLERAFQGALGADHAVAMPGARRTYTFAAPSFGADGKVQAALIVLLDVEGIEFEWRGGRPAVFFTDDAGVVFVSNRSELLLWTVDETGAFCAAACGAASGGLCRARAGGGGGFAVGGRAPAGAGRAERRA